MDVLVKSLVLFGLSLSLCACASNDLRWTEEVKLSDGSVVQITRRTEITSDSGFPANRRGAYKSHEICYSPMNLRWKSAGGYRPDIFDIVGGKAYMNVPIGDCFSCEHYGYPETNALHFVWENETWKKIPEMEFPAISEWNLLYDSQAATADNDARGLVTLSKKLEDRDRSLHFDQKREGWKRISESFSRNRSCKTCRQIKNIIYGTDKDFLEVFPGRPQPSCD